MQKTEMDDTKKEQTHDAVVFCSCCFYLFFWVVLFGFWWVEGMCVHMNVGTLGGQREH